MKKEIYEVALAPGIHFVTGRVLGQWGVHYDRESGNWTVTHLPSGRRFPPPGSKREALRLQICAHLELPDADSDGIFDTDWLDQAKALYSNKKWRL